MSFLFISWEVFSSAHNCENIILTLMFIDLLLKVSWNTKMCPNHQTDVITVIQRKWFHSAVDAKSWSQSGGLSNLFFWCLQCAKISCLEFRVADLGLNAIWYFSLIHSWHLLVTGLYVGMLLSRIFHYIEGFLPASNSLQKWADKVVELSGVCVSMLALCL